MSTSASGPTVRGTSSASSHQYLAVLTATSLRTTTEADGRQRVMLTGVDSTGTWFTDRPQRDAGEASIDTILTKFFADYPTDPPNVVVAMQTQNGPKTVVVEFASPIWDGTALEFVATPLTGEDFAALPARATDVSITVDGGWQSCEVLFVPEYEDQAITGVTVTTDYGDWGALTQQPPYNPAGGPNQYPLYVQGGTPVSWGTSFIASWTGSFAEGCGGTATASIDCGGTQTVTVSFQNPQIGSDQFSFTTQGAGAVLDEQGSTTSGNNLVLQYDVGCDGAP